MVIAYSDLKHPFVPESLYMLPESINNDEDSDDEGILKHGGRIYHKATDRFGGFGLIRSTLAQEIGNCFVLNDDRLPVLFKWNGKEYKLSNELADKIKK